MREGASLVVVGASAGGVLALRSLLSGLRADLAASLVIVLHIRESGVDSLIGLLNQSSRIPVREALHGAPIDTGVAYVAPGNYHLLIEREGCFALSVDDKVCHARPSIDVLFASAADAWRGPLVGVVLTGSNEDGARGLAEIRARGGRAWVQSPAEAEAPQMPEAAIRVAGADAVLPLADIARNINQAFPP